ncbi:hypothetical protein [Roseovarius confluentis]|uniref:hypothetical protein n=1 Tax=Roseovarius confluentis TaxID=1852027 RepID=UPI000CDCE5EC|nr:hypothetical protein [Roseovarius confluentis]
MYDSLQTSIATFGYRRAPVAQAGDIVHAIDEMLQNSDAQPRRIHWVSDSIAMIDRIGVRIAVALLPPSHEDRYTHLVLAIGRSPDEPNGDDLLDVSFAHLADRLIYRIKDDMPYDTIMRGETPEMVDHDLILSLYDLLRKSPPASGPSAPANLDAQPAARQRRTTTVLTTEEYFDVILSEEVPDTVTAVPSWLEKRAVPTKPLRLTVHTMALSIMLYTAPLGAFLFTYSMLRDITGDN